MLCYGSPSKHTAAGLQWPRMTTRRDFLARLISLALFSIGTRAFAAPEAIEKIHRSEEEWRARLTPEQFRVLRHAGTEPKFSSPLDRHTATGEYRCAGCDLTLFTSDMKYDSRTGWPSFFTVIPGRVGTRRDYTLFFMPRTEYHCARCDGHQGHLFHDGPPPTGLRYCNNGVALRFVPG